MRQLPRPIGVGGDLVLRHATPADADAMGAFLVPTWLGAHRDQIPPELWQRRRATWTPAASAEAWCRTLTEIADTPGHPSSVLVVAAPDGGVVGIGMLTLDGAGSAAIDALYVGVDRRHHGVGLLVLAELAAIATDDGASSIEVEVLAANRAGREFYERAGAEFVGGGVAHDDGVALAAVTYRWSEINQLVEGVGP